MYAPCCGWISLGNCSLLHWGICPIALPCTYMPYTSANVLTCPYQVFRPTIGCGHSNLCKFKFSCLPKCRPKGLPKSNYEFFTKLHLIQCNMVWSYKVYGAGIIYLLTIQFTLEAQWMRKDVITFYHGKDGTYARKMDLMEADMCYFRRRACKVGSQSNY